MSFQSSNAVPPGWYPDPSGSRQWRVWNGAAWSELTRPYGESVRQARVASQLGLIVALRRVVVTGIVGVVGGLGLLVGVLAHWPGTAHPAPEWFDVVALDLAVAALVVGSVVCAYGVRELQGHWTLEAFLPGLNLFVASSLVTRRLGRARSWRVLCEIVLLVVFATSARRDLWLFVGPMIVAYVETSWFSSLIDQLSGPATSQENLGP